MKHLLILLILYPMIICGQRCPSQRTQLREPLYNALSGSFIPNDLGLGLRYDRYNDKYGAYISLSYGNRNEFVSHHSKIASGFTLISQGNFLSFGGCYSVNKGISTSEAFDKKALDKWGVEVGAGRQFKRLFVAFRYELIKANSSIDIGYRF
jgi:hypothetical protein